MSANITSDRAMACAAMVAHYDQARAKLVAERPGLFGKALDNKSRKLAIELAGVSLPEGCTVAWATPDDWGQGSGGYRASAAKDMQP